jgi:uncharacterized protein (DUF488 family)
MGYRLFGLAGIRGCDKCCRQLSGFFFIHRVFPLFFKVTICDLREIAFLFEPPWPDKTQILLIVMDFFTIGVFHSTEEEFFRKLIKNKIDHFCDIRQRRGVRGSKYSFVNSNKLQEKLAQLGIHYEYIPGLAPTQKIRDIQNKMDLEKGELKTERKVLGKSFTTEYKKGILEHFDFNSLLKNFEQLGSKRIVFFCVEEVASACHRSLVAEKLQDDFHLKLTNL